MKQLSGVLICLSASIALLVCAFDASPSRRSATAERKTASDDLPFVVIDSGTSSGITTREKYVIKDDAQWLALWQKHAAADLPGRQAPHVDFNSEIVIAVFAGEHHPPGCSIKIDSIKKAENTVIVLVSETGPGADANRSPSPVGDTQPYCITRAAQTALPVVFNGM